MAKTPAKLKGEALAKQQAELSRKRTVADIASGKIQSAPPAQRSAAPQETPEEKEWRETYQARPNSFWTGQEAGAERLAQYNPQQQEILKSLLQLNPELRYQLGIEERPNPQLQEMTKLLGPRLAGVLSQLSGQYGNGYGAPKQQNPYAFQRGQGPSAFPSYNNPRQQIYGDIGNLLGSGLGYGIEQGWNRWRGVPQAHQQPQQGMQALNQLVDPRIHSGRNMAVDINPNTGQPYREVNEIQGYQPQNYRD